MRSRADQRDGNGGGNNVFEFDDPGIAVGGALARIAAVDKDDSQAALDEMQRHRDADNAGAEHDRIGACHERSFGNSAKSGRGLGESER